MNIIHQHSVLVFGDSILKGIVHNGELSENSLAIHECLKELTTILTPVVRPHPLDFDTKLGFDLKIKLHEGIDDFVLGR